MEFSRNILFYNVPDRYLKCFQRVFQEGMGNQYCIHFYIVQSMKVVQRSLKEHKFHIIVICDKDMDHPLSEHIACLRHFNFSIQIILYCYQWKNFFLCQKFDIYFSIRYDHFEEDCDALVYYLTQIYQKGVYFLKKSGQPVSIHSITYIESDKNYVLIHSTKGNWKERASMKELMEQEVFQHFLLISQSILVNPYHIKEVCHDYIVLITGETFYISRSKLKEVHERYTAFYFLK